MGLSSLSLKKVNGGGRGYLTREEESYTQVEEKRSKYTDCILLSLSGPITRLPIDCTQQKPKASFWGPEEAREVGTMTLEGQMEDNLHVPLVRLPI